MRRSNLIGVVLLGLQLASCAVPLSYKKEGDQVVLVIHNGMSGGYDKFPVHGADVATFHQLSDPEYGADKNAVYFHGDKIPNAQPSGFKELPGAFWSDGIGVFFLGERLPGADAETFVVLSTAPWSCDKSKCFRASSLVSSADPKTFKPINFMWAKDAQHFYAYDHARIITVNCDYASMTLLNSVYAKDKNRVFWLGGEIKGADAASFEILSEQMAKDKFRRYSGPEEYWVDVKAREQR
jgi:hypothetical protein